MGYVYKPTGTPRDPLYTVGYYGPDGWEAESDHRTRSQAAARVHYLNGGEPASEPEHGFYREQVIPHAGGA